MFTDKEEEETKNLEKEIECTLIHIAKFSTGIVSLTCLARGLIEAPKFDDVNQR